MNAKMNINNVRNHYDTIGQLEQDAASRETSVEIMYAIAEAADDTVALESIWENGTNQSAIIARAWGLASNHVNVLHWGASSFTR